MWQLSWPLSEEKAFQLMNSANPNISSPTHTETCGAHTAENKQKYDQHTHGSGSVLLAEALRLCAGWHEPLVNMLKRTHPNNITGHPTYDRDPHQPCEASPPHPTRCLSTHNSTNTCMNSNSNSSDDVHVDADVGLVTLLGDASHPMSPFKGQGANQAILDAVSLAKCLEMLSSFTPTNTDADTNYPRIAIGHDQEYGGQGHEGEYVMRLRNRHRHRQRQRHAQKHQHHHFPSVPTTTITTTPTTNITAAETTKAIATTFRKFESEMYIRSTPKVLKSRSAALYLHSPYALAKGNYTRAYAAENLNLK